jgi:hypothetical protein
MELKMAPKNISFPAPAAPVDSQRPRCCLRLQRRVQCSARPHPTRPLQSRQARDPAPAGSCASALSRLRTSLLGYSGARPSLFGPTTVSYSISDRPSFQRTPNSDSFWDGRVKGESYGAPGSSAMALITTFVGSAVSLLLHASELAFCLQGNASAALLARSVALTSSESVAFWVQ